MGSVPTPYIFDDRCDWQDVADNLKEWHDTDVKERRQVGLKAREWATSKEVGFTAKHMADNMSDAMEGCFKNFKPREKFMLHKV